MRFLGELAQARNNGIDIERASTTWLSFTSYHGQLLSLAVQWLLPCQPGRQCTGPRRSSSFAHHDTMASSPRS